MSKSTELITTLKHAELLNSFFKSALLVGGSGGNPKCKKKKYGDFERNEGLRKNATDIKQKRVILMNEPA